MSVEIRSGEGAACAEACWKKSFAQGCSFRIYFDFNSAPLLKWIWDYSTHWMSCSSRGAASFICTEMKFWWHLAHVNISNVMAQQVLTLKLLIVLDILLLNWQGSVLLRGVGLQRGSTESTISCSNNLKLLCNRVLGCTVAHRTIFGRSWCHTFVRHVSHQNKPYRRLLAAATFTVQTGWSRIVV